MSSLCHSALLACVCQLPHSLRPEERLDVDATLQAFDQAAVTLHAADTEIALVRTYMQGARRTRRYYSTSGDCTVTTTVCDNAPRSRLRSHQTAPRLTAHSLALKPSRRAMVCPSVG